MEELQSTEILDREILEDARKKAYRILKSADESAAANAAAWDKKAAAAVSEMRSSSARRLEKTSREIMARLSLDKRRARSEIIEGLLASAVEDWVSGLSRVRVLDILEGELAGRFAECPEINEAEKIQVLLHNVKTAEAEGVLKKSLAGKIPPVKFSEEPSKDSYPEIIVNTPEVRIRASLKMLLDSLLRDKRRELLAALVGAELADGGTP